MSQNKTPLVIGGSIALALLTAIAAMVYLKGYPWTCGQATAEVDQSNKRSVQAAKDAASGLLDEQKQQKFKDELARSESATATKIRLCR